VFDIWNLPDTPLHDRAARVRNRVLSPLLDGAHVKLVNQTLVRTLDAVDTLFENALTLGYEGLVLRNPMGLYKYGRSTVKEAGLLKMKPFVDAEATVVGRVELLHNENEAFTNELGRTARSHAKAGKVGGGVLGALICRTPEGIEFEVGTGFSATERVSFWQMDTEIMGKIVKYKSLVVGVKDRPRHAVFLGFRDRLDM
jgi:DNA ligase-1